MIEIGQNLTEVIIVVAFMAFIFGPDLLDRWPRRASKGSGKAPKATTADTRVSTLPRTTICAMCGHRQSEHDPKDPRSPHRSSCEKCGVPFIWSWPVIPGDADVRGPGAPEA